MSEKYISASALKAHYSWLGKDATLSPKDVAKWDGELLVMGLGYVINAPTIESSPDWTPCAEGLPTPEQAVIDHDYQKFFVTLQNLDGKRFIERCAYRCERWWMFDYQCYVDETHAIALAWMPCPTTPYNPYRADDTTGKAKEN